MQKFMKLLLKSYIINSKKIAVTALTAVSDRFLPVTMTGLTALTTFSDRSDRALSVR